ncbi:prenyl cysteine carboxyl methyltransferase [Penicillium argentinense]|uniref:Prenyl cysteine carboxyl methyltransferase n=1 Tax=Penicillium argentinense TaxID=1131581 RepID=A0A9W9G0R7_9EURO|nr:prenyl cysteine carboxyl methyltransferase [Penicillium argentinense]KAJ5110021.1 prenyl cysteine carboxyl methyltransferase [Penicillium argentinense]
MDLSSVLLATTIGAAAYLVKICSKSPNPPPQSRHTTDTIGPLVGTFTNTLRRAALGVMLFQAALALFVQSPERIESICAVPSNLNESLVTWDKTTIISLFLIFLGAVIRLSAYGGLGQNFTFHLAAPDHLVTDGVYRFMQHPSYTGQAVLCLGVAGAFVRWDASVACFIPGEVLNSLRGWVAALLRARVRDEEGMLKGEFGKEWEVWSARTARFVPFIW